MRAFMLIVRLETENRAPFSYESVNRAKAPGHEAGYLLCASCCTFFHNCERKCELNSVGSTSL